jgi:hypothetical protein
VIFRPVIPNRLRRNSIAGPRMWPSSLHAPRAGCLLQETRFQWIPFRPVGRGVGGSGTVSGAGSRPDDEAVA